MTFENPIWLYLAPVIAVFAAGLTFYGLHQREQLLSQFAAARLLKKLTEKASHTRAWIKGILLTFGLSAIAIALSQPQYGVEWSERKARGLDIIFVLDSSKSMLATDLRPTRLARAKLAILDLIERLDSDRIGIVAYAGQAFLQTPPTLDYSAFRESLDAIDPESMTRGGSDLGSALSEAIKAFPSENNVKAIILLTDGEDLRGTAISSIENATAAGIKIFAIGIGTPEGEYLRAVNQHGVEDFVRDAQGQPVRSQLDESTLQELARITNGSYSRLSDQSLDQLFNDVIATLPRSERESEMQERRIERYQWALSAACLFLVVEILIRRRKGSITQLAAALLLISALSPQISEAQDGEPIVEENLPFEAGILEEPEPTQETPERITDPRELYNKAHRQLTEAEFDTARQNLSESIRHSGNLSLQRDALYNMGHSIFQNGEAAFQAQDFEKAIEVWKEAEATFKSAYEVDPNDQQALDDAALVEARRKALEEFLKQQEQQQDQQQNQEQENSEDREKQESQGNQEGESDSSQDQQEQSSDEQQEDESSEQQQSDSQQSEQEQQQQESQNDESEQEQNNEESEALPELGEEEEPEGDEEQPAPQAHEGESSDQDTAQAQQSQPVQIQGMTEEDAQRLLDSLLNNEQLLPFVNQDDQQRTNRTQPIQDW